MYEGIRNKDLRTLVQKLEDEQLLKRDLVVPANALTMLDGEILMRDLPEDLFSSADMEKILGDFGIATSEPSMIRFEPTDQGLSQICEKMRFPKRYLSRLAEQGYQDLIDHNLTELFNRTDANYFVRTFAPSDEGGLGLLRGFLSDRYQVVDHLHVIDATLKGIQKTGADLKIGKCNLTDRSMYVEFIAPESKITAEDYIGKYRSPNGGDDPFIYAGFVISNSETGQGSYQIAPRAIVGACENGMLFKRDAMRKTHVGSQMDEGIKWSRDTQRKHIELIESQITDAVTTFSDVKFLEEKFTELGQYNDRLEFPVDAVQNVCDDLMLSRDERANVMNYFLDGDQFTPMGVSQALTYHAHEVDSADKQYEIETEAVEILSESFVARFDRPSKN